MPAPTATSVTEFASGAAGLIVVMSGVFAGMARSLAVLLGASDKHVERLTAAGFLLGAAIAVLLLAEDEIGR